MRSNYHRSGSIRSTCEVLLNPKMMGKFIGKSVDALGFLRWVMDLEIDADPQY